MFFFYIFIFLICCAFLYFSGDWVVNSLMGIAEFLGWREFVLSFFVMAFASSLPNLFLAVSSVFHKVPQLSLGDILGGNVIDLTLIAALAILFAKNGEELPAESRMVQTSYIFTMVAAILPVFLLLDGSLSRIDGALLVFLFFLYIFWLFSKKERFTKIYNNGKIAPAKNFKNYLKNIGKIILGIIFLLAAAEGIVRSAQFFAVSLNLPLTMLGILIVGLGNALPETYFAVASARKGETWMVFGDLMGAVVVPATLILGLVALICPIKTFDFPSISIAGFFLIISSLLFFLFIRNDRKITKKEALFLLLIYIIFVAVEIAVNLKI